MKPIVIGFIALLALSLISMSPKAALADEHPSEHPQEHPAEHPEHPVKKSAEALTVDELAEAITDYVEADAELKGGYFLVYDDANDEVLALRLKLVHRERLSHLGDNTYFACADFEATNGKLYDLDIFMQGESADAMEIDQITVHKENGAARYGWAEEDGVWVMVAAD